MGAFRLLLLAVSLLCSNYVHCQSVSDEEIEKKREQLKWFPADMEEDCIQEPGVEQVR